MLLARTAMPANRQLGVVAAIIAVDDSGATESRIPATVYDFLGTGVPVIVAVSTLAGPGGTE